MPGQPSESGAVKSSSVLPLYNHAPGVLLWWSILQRVVSLLFLFLLVVHRVTVSHGPAENQSCISVRCSMMVKGYTCYG